MCGRSCCCLLALLFVILSPLALRSQSDARNPATGPRIAISRPEEPVFRRPIGLSPHPAPGTIGLREIARAAGLIFSGTVTAIEKHPATPSQAVETVAVTFHVENAIRGTTPGDNLTVREWIGVWSAGQRFRKGDHVLVFLYPPSKLGLTSCIGASYGVLRVDAAGRVLLSALQLSAFRPDLDLGGRSRVSFRDFAWAVRRASEQE